MRLDASCSRSLLTGNFWECNWESSQWSLGLQNNISPWITCKITSIQPSSTHKLGTIVLIFHITNGRGDKIWGGFKKKWARGLGTETSTCMLEVLALAVEALVPLRHKAVNVCLVNSRGSVCEPVPHIMLDIVIWGESVAPQSLRGPKMAYSQGERSGLYRGWPRTSHLMIVLAIWDLALSWSRMTPEVSLPGRFDLIAWRKVFKVCE